MTRFNRAASWFVPESLRSDPGQHVRALMVASGTIVSWCVCVPVLLVLLIILRGHPAAQLFAFSVTMSGVASWVLALLMLRWFESFTLCIHTLVGAGSRSSPSRSRRRVASTPRSSWP